MANIPTQLITALRRLTYRQTNDVATDASLLARFVRDEDQAAFEELVARHSRLVLSLARRVLSDVHAAEDVFQATFLLLARKAAQIRRPENVSAWLYGVAYHLALRSRTAENRRRARETRSFLSSPSPSSVDPLDELSAREMLLVLDWEIQRLPEVYRLPVILCCVEGRTYAEAARQLGWTIGALQGRLKRGRSRLHARLVKRGLTLSTALAALEAAHGFTDAAVSTALAGLKVKAAIASAGTGSGAISAEVSAMVEAGLKGLAAAKTKVGTMLLLAVATLVTGSVAIGLQVVIAQTRVAEQLAAPKPAEPDAQPIADKQDARPRSDHYGDPLPDGAIARLGTVRLRTVWHGMVAFRPDARSVTTYSAGGVSVWDVTTGREMKHFSFHPPAWVVQFSADGRRIGSELNINTIQIWDAASGKERSRFGGGRTSGDVAFALSADGARVATASGDNTLHVWDADKGTEIRNFPGDHGGARLLAFSPKGDYLASTSGQGLTIWDIATGKATGKAESSTSLNALLWLPASEMVVTGDKDGTLRLWETPSGKPLGVLGEKQAPQLGTVCHLACSPDGRILISATDSQQHIDVWDIPGRRLLRRLTGFFADARHLAVSPDGRTAAAGCGDCVVHLWDLATGQLKDPAPAPRGRIYEARFSSDGAVLATASEDGTVYVWQTAGWTELRRIKRTPSPCTVPQHPVFVAGHQLLSPGWGPAGGVGQVWHLWDADSGKELRSFDFYGKRLSARSDCAYLSADGRILAAQDTVFDAATMKPLYALDNAYGDALAPNVRFRVVTQVRKVPVNGYANGFTADGKQLVVGSPLGGITLCEPLTGAVVRKLPSVQNVSAIYGSDISWIGKQIVGGTQNGEVVLWDLETGHELRRFSGHEGIVGSVALSPDCKMVASVSGNTPGKSTDGVIYLWEVATGKVRRRFAGHGFYVTSLTFAPDNKSLVSTSADTTCLVWGLLEHGARGVPVTREQIEAAWHDLRDLDAAKAYRGMCTLSGAPSEATRFIGERLSPIAAEPTAELRQAIADLDNDRFAVRQRAMETLTNCAFQAEAALRRELTQSPSLHVRKSVEELLRKLSLPSSNPECLRQLRAVEILEHIGTQLAKQLLLVIARGVPEARLTKEAKAAVDRLARLTRRSTNQ